MYLDKQTDDSHESNKKRHYQTLQMLHTTTPELYQHETKMMPKRNQIMREGYRTHGHDCPDRLLPRWTVEESCFVFYHFSMPFMYSDTGWVDRKSRTNAVSLVKMCMYPRVKILDPRSRHPPLRRTWKPRALVIPSTHSVASQETSSDRVILRNPRCIVQHGSMGYCCVWHATRAHISLCSGCGPFAQVGGHFLPYRSHVLRRKAPRLNVNYPARLCATVSVYKHYWRGVPLRFPLRLVDSCCATDFASL